MERFRGVKNKLAFKKIEHSTFFLVVAELSPIMEIKESHSEPTVYKQQNIMLSTSYRNTPDFLILPPRQSPTRNKTEE